ncbi:MAG: hypothetical protein ACHP7H_00820 [Hyphomicrobiales bacterium]
MPKVSTNGPKNLVTRVFGVDHPASTYVYAGDDTYASVAAQPPAGATLQLPGPNKPNTNPDVDNTDLPSNGDYYKFADPRGHISGAHPVVIDGGGYPILGNPTLTITAAFAEGELTFDDEAQAWIACICFPPAPG